MIYVDSCVCFGPCWDREVHSQGSSPTENTTKNPLNPLSDTNLNQRAVLGSESIHHFISDYNADVFGATLVFVVDGGSGLVLSEINLLCESSLSLSIF